MGQPSAGTAQFCGDLIQHAGSTIAGDYATICSLNVNYLTVGRVSKTSRGKAHAPALRSRPQHPDVIRSPLPASICRRRSSTRSCPYFEQVRSRAPVQRLEAVAVPCLYCTGQLCFPASSRLTSAVASCLLSTLSTPLSSSFHQTSTPKLTIR
jgi:hypothetical protein